MVSDEREAARGGCWCGGGRGGGGRVPGVFACALTGAGGCVCVVCA